MSILKQRPFIHGEREKFKRKTVARREKGVARSRGRAIVNRLTDSIKRMRNRNHLT